MSELETFVQKLLTFFKTQSAVRIIIKADSPLLKKEILSMLLKKSEKEDPVYDVLELGDKSFIGIDEVRKIKEFLSYGPSRASRKYVIINEMTMMTAEAASAALKIIEEPPDFSAFICFSSNIDDVFPTIKSRFSVLKPYIDLTESIKETLKTEDQRTKDLLKSNPELMKFYVDNADSIKQFLNLLDSDPAALFLKGAEEDNALMLPAAAERILLSTDVKTLPKIFQKFQSLLNDDKGEKINGIFFNAALILIEDLVTFNFSSYWKSLNRKSYFGYYVKMNAPSKEFVKRFSEVKNSNVSKDLLFCWLLLNFATLKKV